MIIVDTNVISEMMKPAPAPKVVSWTELNPPSALYTTTITLAEIRYGIERLPRAKRRDALEAAAEAIFTEFGPRVVSFDAQAAVEYGQIVAAEQRAGREIAVLDAEIAAIVRSNGATLATRNIRDFEGGGVDLVNPWV